MPSLRKKRPLTRTEGTLRDARLIVIATEGEKTEESYFLAFGSSRVKIRILPCELGLSSPEHVFSRILSYKQEYQLGGDDQLWIALDVDRWGDKKLSDIAASCSQADIGMAVSNPCFEAWIALHLDIDPNDKIPDQPKCSDVVKVIRGQLRGYNKSNPPLERILPTVSRAVERAKMNFNESHRWPNSFGSHVFKVVEEIQALSR